MTTKTKVAALIGILTALAAAAVLPPGQCQKLEDALAELDDYPDLQQALVNTYGEGCAEALAGARNKCVELPGGFTCRRGLLYGPGEGGTRTCTDPGDTPMCLSHHGDLDSLGVSREQLLEILHKRKVEFDP